MTDPAAGPVTGPAADAGAVRVDQFLAHPPARVWRALTDPGLLARWLMPNDFRPAVGHAFTFRTDPRPAAGFDGIEPGDPGQQLTRRILGQGWRSNVLAALQAVLAVLA